MRHGRNGIRTVPPAARSRPERHHQATATRRSVARSRARLARRAHSTTGPARRSGASPAQSPARASPRQDGRYGPATAGPAGRRQLPKRRRRVSCREDRPAPRRAHRRTGPRRGAGSCSAAAAGYSAGSRWILSPFASRAAASAHSWSRSLPERGEVEPSDAHRPEAAVPRSVAKVAGAVCRSEDYTLARRDRGQALIPHSRSVYPSRKQRFQVLNVAAAHTLKLGRLHDPSAAQRFDHALSVGVQRYVVGEPFIPDGS